MKQTKGDVQSRDLDVPPGWARTSLGEIYELTYGKNLPKAARNARGDYPVYGSNGVIGYHDSFLAEGPLIVVGRKGAAGAISFSAKPCWPIDTTYFVRGSEHIDIRFSFYLFASLRLDQFDRSTAIPGLNRDDAYDLVIDLPPLGEQQRIVSKIEELFSELDKGVESLKTVRAQLKVYRQAVLKHAFEGKLTAKWREENKDELETAEQLLARVKRERDAQYEQRLNEWKVARKKWEESGKSGKRPKKPRKLPKLTGLSHNLISKLPSLPNCWVWEKLGWITCGMEYGTAAKSAPTGKVPVLRMGNIQDAQFDWSDLVYTSRDDEIAEFQLHSGDVLFNRTNSPELVGKTAIYNGEQPAVFAGYLIRINHIRAIISGRYLNLFLNSDVALQHGNSVKTDGVNQSNINGTKLLNYPFPYCSIEEQREIASRLEERLSILDKTEDDIRQELEVAAALRQSILRKSFSGQLVEQNPNDETATVLLERIKAEKASQKPKTKPRKRQVASA